jgi:hypothetical protein
LSEGSQHLSQALVEPSGSSCLYVDDSLRAEFQELASCWDCGLKSLKMPPCSDISPACELHLCPRQARAAAPRQHHRQFLQLVLGLGLLSKAVTWYCRPLTVHSTKRAETRQNLTVT